MLVTANPPNGRGCGYRDEDSVYFCCGQSVFGLPMEHFICDPVIPWVGGWSRGMKILPRKDGINDLVIFVGRGAGSGEELYPYYWDFIEEARLYGVSRKGNKNIPFEKLTPGKSYMLFVHARAIPKFNFEVYHPEWKVPHHPKCKSPNKLKTDDFGTLPELHNDKNNTVCTFAAKDLALFLHPNDYNDLDDGTYRIEGPSYDYECVYPVIPDKDIKAVNEFVWEPGIFLMLPLTHIEAKKKLDPTTTEKINRAGYSVEILEY